MSQTDFNVHAMLGILEWFKANPDAHELVPSTVEYEMALGLRRLGELQRNTVNVNLFRRVRSLDKRRGVANVWY